MSTLVEKGEQQLNGIRAEHGGYHVLLALGRTSSPRFDSTNRRDNIITGHSRPYVYCCGAESGWVGYLAQIYTGQEIAPHQYPTA
jgi:hypothetical protein